MKRENPNSKEEDERDEEESDPDQRYLNEEIEKEQQGHY